MKVIIFLCLMEWTRSSYATAPYADRGLVVGRVPFFWYDAELDIFQGDIESFTTASDISPKVYALNGYEHVSSMKSDPNNERLIYLDYQRQLIVALENFNTWVNNTNITERVIHEGLSDTYHARIAYDWLTGNIYWTDNKYDWIAIKNVDHPDTSAYKILIHEGLRIPKAIAIDPIKRLLFYAEYGYSNTMLMRSDLLGGDRTIIRSGLRWVSDMVADHHSSMLYWVDNTRLSVERSDYDGNQWEVIYRKSSNVFFTAITSYKNLVCIVDYYIQEVSCINKISGTVTWTTSYNYKFPWGMDAYAIDNHPQEAHPCQNYGCSDVCINTNDGAKCICKEGYELEPNNPKNCIASNILKGKRLLFTNGTDVCMFDIRVLTGYKDNASCFMHWNGTINFMVVDTNRTKLFFHDESKSEIYSYDLITKTSKNLVTTGALSGLQYDWIGNKLYWSESDIGAIKVASASMTDVTTTIVNNLEKPRNLEVYPHGRRLFWIAGTSNAPMIQSYSFDTQNVVTILNHATLKDPQALCYSAGHEKLYFVDGGFLKGVNTDGSELNARLVLHSSSDLQCYKDYAVYYPGGDSITSRNIYDGSSGSIFSTDISQFKTITALATFDPNLQRKETNACETNNGGCEQICFATSNTDRECKCSFGFEIQTNGLNCTSRPKMNNFALTVDYRHRKIFQIDIINGSNINAIDLDESARPVAATYFNQHIYWSDYETDKLHMSNMSGGNTSTIYNMELSLCFSLAVDPSTGNVYYVGVPYTRPTKPAYLAVVHPGTSKHKRLLDKIEIAGSIALYPSKGLMFWIDQGDDDYSGRIERASMDGKNRKSLFPYGLPHPVSIAVGYRENKIYWTDALDDSINYCDLDGSNKGVLYNDVNVRMNHIAVGPSNVFYNAHNVQRVMKLNKNTEKPQVWMNKQPEMGRLESLDVFVDGYSIPVHKSCNINNGLCSTFCLPRTEILRTCACEDGAALLEDKRTCDNVLSCPTDIPNGAFDDTCMPYKGNTCGFHCKSGYSRTTADSRLLCAMHPDLPNTLHWNKSMANLCEKTLITSTVAPIITTLMPGVMENLSQISSGTFAGVIVAVVIIFMIIILGLIFVMFRRRTLKMHSNGKFPSARSIPPLENIIVSRDGDFDNLDEKDTHEPKSSNGTPALADEGMDNPLYFEKNTERKNKNPYVTTIDVSKM